MKDFFISYNKADQSWAEWIAWVLEEQGFSTVIQAWDFKPGSNFVLDMQKATSESKKTIALLSPDYLQSKFTQPEWAAAFREDPTGEKGLLIPVRVRECMLDGMLASIIYVDIIGLSEIDAQNTLLAGIRNGRPKPGVKPPFPIKSSTIKKPRFPGMLPSVWNIPHLRNPNFTGREELLEDLRSSLTSGQRAALTQAIHGLGGVGKTQLALEYLYRYAHEYDYIWWLRSEEAANLTTDYANLAVTLGLAQKDEMDIMAKVQSARNWLGQNNKWLLIFDNVQDPSDIRDYLPQAQTGHVIITSRNPSFRGMANPLKIDVLNRSESIDFLLKRTGQTDSNAAGFLSDSLGYLPLALEQAGAYIETSGISIAEYHILFNKKQTELLNRPGLSTDYPHSVVTTWSLSFQEIKKHNSSAANLLILCSFFAPEDIPAELITNNKHLLPESLSNIADDQLKFDDTISILRRYSMIEFTNKGIFIHRLVQAVIKGWLDETLTSKWIEIALKLVGNSFKYKSDDPHTWPKSARLSSHVMVVCSSAEESDIDQKEASRLMNECGLFLKDRAEFSEAKQLLKRALVAAEKSLEPGNPSIAASQSNLALVLQDLGELEDARDLLRKALASNEKSFNPGNPSIARIQSNLAMVLRDLGELEEAKDLLRKALASDEKSFEPGLPSIAIRQSNLAVVLQDLGELEEAMDLFRKALASNEKLFEPGHPSIAIRQSNLALVLQDLGELGEARNLARIAYEAFLSKFGPQHPKTIIMKRNWKSI